MPMGKDTYIVTGSSEFGTASAQKAAVSEANAFAAARGKRMLPLTVQSGGELDFMGDTIRTYELQFRLVGEDDPEWQRTQLNAVPDTVVTINDTRNPAIPKADVPSPDLLVELKKLRALLDEGAITQDEFDELKARLLAKDEN